LRSQKVKDSSSDLTFNETQMPPWFRDGVATLLLGHSSRERLNYRDREKILLAMQHDPAKSGGHEVCSRVSTRLHCVCISSIRGFATALSSKTGATL
jgi:hypothetical protein